MTYLDKEILEKQESQIPSPNERIEQEEAKGFPSPDRRHPPAAPAGGVAAQIQNDLSY
jgi:hypothetical protein